MSVSPSIHPSIIYHLSIDVSLGYLCVKDWEQCSKPVNGNMLPRKLFPLNALLPLLHLLEFTSHPANAARGNKPDKEQYICVALPSTQLSLGPTRSGVWSRTPGSTWQTCVLGPSLSPILAAPHSNLPLPRAHDKFWPCKTPKVALAVSWFGD